MSESRPRPKIRLTVSPEAQRYVRRDAPVDVRRMAAGGALPLPPVDLATVLFALMHDPDSQVKERARQSLEALPRNIVTSVMGGTASPPVLSYLARIHKEDEGLMQDLALNAACDDATVAFLAGLPHRRVVDIVANNQERLLRCPEIVDALGGNPLTGRAVIDRILSFLGLSRPDAETEEPEDGDDDWPEPDEVTDDSAIAALRAVLGDDVAELGSELTRDSDRELTEEEVGSLFARVQNMTVMQKIKLARLGNKEARGLLIRDTNKIVASAAIRSPKITDSEVATYAKSRGLHEEVIRTIALNREWTKNYQVKHALATNPKTPQGTAMKFLNHLQDRDLKSIMKSKDVPSVISTHARRILTKKGKV